MPWDVGATTAPYFSQAQLTLRSLWALCRPCTVIEVVARLGEGSLTVMPTQEVLRTAAKELGESIML